MEPVERDDAHGPSMVSTCDYDGITLHEWMWSPRGLGLALTSPDLMVYAKIYSVSHHNTGAMTASQPKLAQLFSLTRETVNRALRRLVDNGLVYVCGTVRGKGRAGRPVNVYAVCQDPINRAVSRCRSMAEANQLSPTASEAAPLLDKNVTRSHICSDKGDRRSHTNVTGKTNVTESHIRERGALPAETRGFQHSPLIPKTNPNPIGETKKRRELTETEFLAFRTLLSKSLKPVPERYIDEARELFASCVDEGIGPELLLSAYGRYAKQLIASRNSGGRYHPMSLSHFLMRNKGTETDPRHNSWIEDEVARSRAETDASGKGTRLFRDTSTGLWIAFPARGEPEYIPGIDAGADEARARDVWEAYVATKRDPRR